ncbi:MAG: TolC family outer membrane protein [Desulfuromonadales bacterium]|nr:TolC family outer membrane protein [Desulfuromonadales bacterium]
MLSALAILVGSLPALAADQQVSLTDSVVTALEYSPRLQILQNNEQAIAHERDRAWGGYLPRLDVTFGYGAEAHSDESTRGRDIAHNYYDRLEASARLSQLLYDGRETGSLVAVEDAKLDSARFRTVDNAEAIALDAVIAHMEVYRQRELLGLAEKNVADHRDILGKLEERREAGAGSIADVDQTQSRLSRALASLAEVRRDLQTAEANYMRVIGKLPGQLVSYDMPKELLPASLDAALKGTVANNPKVRAYNANVAEAEQRIALSNSNFLPKVHLELSSSYEDQVESLETYEHNNQAMVRLRWNILNGGSTVADRKAAISRKLQAAATRNDQEDLAIEETRATWAELESARAQVVAYGDAVNFSQRTLDSYLKQFNVGQRTLLDVLDARNEQFQNSGLLVTAMVNEVVAVQRLLALSGSLNQSLNIGEDIYMTRLVE